MIVDDGAEDGLSNIDKKRVYKVATNLQKQTKRLLKFFKIRHY